MKPVTHPNLKLGIKSSRFLQYIILLSVLLTLDEPSLKYLVISVNGEIPIVIKNNESLQLVEGDSINISHIKAKDRLLLGRIFFRLNED